MKPSLSLSVLLFSFCSNLFGDYCQAQPINSLVNRGSFLTSNELLNSENDKKFEFLALNNDKMTFQDGEAIAAPFLEGESPGNSNRENYLNKEKLSSGSQVKPARPLELRDGSPDLGKALTSALRNFIGDQRAPFSGVGNGANFIAENGGKTGVSVQLNSLNKDKPQDSVLLTASKEKHQPESVNKTINDEGGKDKTDDGDVSDKAVGSDGDVSIKTVIDDGKKNDIRNTTVTNLSNKTDSGDFNTQAVSGHDVKTDSDDANAESPKAATTSSSEKPQKDGPVDETGHGVSASVIEHGRDVKDYEAQKEAGTVIGNMPQAAALKLHEGNESEGKPEGSTQNKTVDKKQEEAVNENVLQQKIQEKVDENQEQPQKGALNKGQEKAGEIQEKTDENQAKSDVNKVETGENQEQISKSEDKTDVNQSKADKNIIKTEENQGKSGENGPSEGGTPNQEAGRAPVATAAAEKTSSKPPVAIGDGAATAALGQRPQAPLKQEGKTSLTGDSSTTGKTSVVSSKATSALVPAAPDDSLAYEVDYEASDATSAMEGDGPLGEGDLIPLKGVESPDKGVESSKEEKMPLEDADEPSDKKVDPLQDGNMSSTKGVEPFQEEGMPSQEELEPQSDWNKNQESNAAEQNPRDRPQDQNPGEKFPPLTHGSNSEASSISGVRVEEFNGAGYTPESGPESHFGYLVLLSMVAAGAYLLYLKRKKVVALLLEGRRRTPSGRRGSLGRRARGRGGGYSLLPSNGGEASLNTPSHSKPSSESSPLERIY